MGQSGILSIAPGRDNSGLAQWRRAALIGLALGLSACGGGGSDSPPPPPPPPPPTAQAGVLQLSAPEYVVDETSTTVAFEVTRTGGSDGAVTVDITASSGSATAGTDFGTITTTARFGDGDTGIKSGNVIIFDDNDDEPDETFVLTLSSVTGGATIGGQSTASVKIIDDDPARVALQGVASGVSGSGLVVRNNGGADVPILSDGTFTVAPSIAEGESYDIEIAAEPWAPAQTCTVMNGSGTVGVTDITDILVDCVDANLQSMIVRRQPDGETQGDLYLFREDGQVVQPLATSPDEERYKDTVGDWIIFERRTSVGADLYSVRRDGTQITPLAVDPDEDRYVGVTANGIVVFNRANNIFSVNVDGTGPQQLTNLADVDTAQHVTTDGRVVFSRSTTAGSDSDLYAMDINGSNVVTLANTARNESFVAATPMGRVIVLSPENGLWDLYSISLDGTNQAIIANDPAISERFVALLDNDVVVFSRDISVAQRDLYSIRSDGTGLAALADSAGVEVFLDAVTGDRVIYRLDSGNQSDLFVVSHDGTNRVPLAVQPVHESYGGTMSDGRVIFMRDAGGPFDVYSVDLDGTHESPVVTTAEHELVPSFSCNLCDNYPVSKADRVVFERHIGNQNDLFSIKTDGSDERQLATTPQLDLIQDVTRTKGVIYFDIAGNLHRVGADGNGSVALAPSADYDSFITLLD